MSHIIHGVCMYTLVYIVLEERYAILEVKVPSNERGMCIYR